MLLERLCDYAERRPEVPPSNYLEQPVRFIIQLDKGGTTLGPPIDTADPGTRETKLGVKRLVPHLKKAQGIRPRLLSDVREYVFGIDEPGKQGRARDRHSAFLELIRECARQTGDPTVAAVERFVDRVSDSPPEWTSELPTNALITFRVGDVFPVDQPSVREFWANVQADGATTFEHPMNCIVCGEFKTVLRRHPLKIRGVPQGQLSGTDLISANKDVFESYGLGNSIIAPTCFSCAWKYGNALNLLLAGDETRLRLGNVVYVFWTAEDVVFRPGSLLSEPDPTEVRELLDAARSGKASAVSLSDTAFYALGLSGSGARIAVRSWIDTTVGRAQASIARYFALQDIVDTAGDPGDPLPIWRLAGATVRDPRKDAIAPGVSDALFELALAGRRLPEDVLSRAIQRCRAGQGVSRERAALIKMAIGSELGWSRERMDAMRGLDTTNEDAAYLCGRLLAVLDAIQRRAISANATVIDKFYGSASSAPASVFGNLLDNAQNHLAKLRKNPSTRGASIALDARLMDVLEGLEEFPRTLTMPQQAMFALGFYHQRAADRRAARERREGQPDDDLSTIEPVN